MVEYMMGGKHGGNNDNNMTLQDVADVGNTGQPTMGGEQGVNNNDNNIPQAPLQVDIGNTEQPTMGVEQGGNNEKKSLIQQTLNEGASSPKSIPRPPSPLPCPATKMPAIHRMINSYEPKKKSSDVDLLLKVLKNKPKQASASGKESYDVQVLKKVRDEKSLTCTSFQKQKEEKINMLSLDEVPDKYEHGKPFCFWWKMNEGLPELMSLH
jgi:hypothetical protein